MIRRYLFLYLIVLTIPLSLGFTAWQSARYSALNREVRRLEAVQEDWIENNKRLIAGIAVLSSSGRIESIAVNELGLSKVQPENVLQIRVQKREGGGE